MLRLLFGFLLVLLWLPGETGAKPLRENRVRSKSSRLKTFIPEKAYSGITLYPDSGTAEVRLLGIDGQPLKLWHVDAARARLLPNCNLLVVHGSVWGRKQKKWQKLRRYIREYNWEGKVVWEFKAPRTAHHDVVRLENGNTLLIHQMKLHYDVLTKEISVVDSFLADVPANKRKVLSDKVLEIDSSGNEVWSFAAHRHLDIESCGGEACKLPVASPHWIKQPKDWTHFNTVSVIPENRWFKEGDLRFRPGNLLITARNLNRVFLVDKKTKKVVWTFNGRGSGELGLQAPHEAHMIEIGKPGAGNLLIFDNGREQIRPYSIALEINPVTKEKIWDYQNSKEFFSRAAGSLQRFPNGNTLISEDTRRRVFEVTDKGEIVWDYRGDFRGNRVHRYPIGFCSKFDEFR